MEALPKLTVAQAHALLYFTAEILARQCLLRFDPGMKAQLDKEIADLKASKDKALAVIKKKHGTAGE